MYLRGWTQAESRRAPSHKDMKRELKYGSTLDGYKWSTSRPGRFNPGKEPTEWKAGWAALTAGLDRFWTKKISCPRRDSNPDRPACSLITIPTELSLLLRVPQKAGKFPESLMES